MTRAVTYVVIAILVLIAVLLALVLWQVSSNTTSSKNQASSEKPTLPSSEGESAFIPPANPPSNVPTPLTTPTNASTSPAEVSETRLRIGTQWGWLRTDGQGRNILSNPPINSPFVLTFTNETSMDSATDCNQIGGSYQLDGSTLSFGDLYSTKMYCEGSLENEYRQQLESVETFVIDDTTLYLYLAEEAGVMVFEERE